MCFLESRGDGGFCVWNFLGGGFVRGVGVGFGGTGRGDLSSVPFVCSFSFRLDSPLIVHVGR